jgi:transposase InsO family protein|tara:strand:+ start:525 stop:1526 length:1002 start_codon:yes stop_codon:yes gene_type:complete
MRYNQGEKMEIIRTVEDSELSVRRTLIELDIPRSTFYTWYRNYLEHGYDGLADRRPGPRRFWNRIPDCEKEKVVQIALDRPELTSRELAWHITDKEHYYISESIVYRILKSFDLITSPNYILLSASDKFQNPTKRINELWQTDFTYFKIIGWGWYYLATILDDYSRYILSWKLFPTMSAGDVMGVLDMALDNTGVDKVNVSHRPRLLSDNGPCYLSSELKDYLDDRGMDHTRGAPYHPQTQGKIERYHRTMKNVVKLQNYYVLSELEVEIGKFVDYYNNERYHESLDNVTPADMYHGRRITILNERDIIKQETMRKRRILNQKHGSITMQTTT